MFLGFVSVMVRDFPSLLQTFVDTTFAVPSATPFYYLSLQIIHQLFFCSSETEALIKHNGEDMEVYWNTGKRSYSTANNFAILKAFYRECFWKTGKKSVISVISGEIFHCFLLLLLIFTPQISNFKQWFWKLSVEGILAVDFLDIETFF